MNLEELQDFVYKKRFVTRGGIPFSKKMWRDGYNKALDDLLTHMKLLQQEKIPQNSNNNEGF